MPSIKKKKSSKKKRGRKSYYRKSYCQKLIAFFDIEPYEERQIPHYKVKGKKREKVWTDSKRVANRLPTLRNFAKAIGVDTTTVYRWAEKHEEFRTAFTHAKDLRKWFLIENGLNGCYNPLFSKFVAINITDMEDKSAHELTGKDGQPIPVTIVDFGKIDDNT